MCSAQSARIIIVDVAGLADFPRSAHLISFGFPAVENTDGLSLH